MGRPVTVRPGRDVGTLRYQLEPASNPSGRRLLAGPMDARGFERKGSRGQAESRDVLSLPLRSTASLACFLILRSTHQISSSNFWSTGPLTSQTPEPPKREVVLMLSPLEFWNVDVDLLSDPGSSLRMVKKKLSTPLSEGARPSDGHFTGQIAASVRVARDLDGL